ncbi:MAG: hypothetical protein ACLQAT_30740 [Candidatus Binataceae bacterium]
MADSPEFNPATAGNFSIAQILPTLFFDAAMPVIAFNVLTHRGVSTLWALVIGGIFRQSISAGDG